MRSTAALLAGIAMGCDLVADGGPPASVVHDSGGVRIIENESPSWAPSNAWRVDSVPIVTIGTRDGELFRVAGATRQSDGTIVVANAGNAELRLYDRNGMLVRVTGGRGQGPGSSRP